MEFVNIVQYIYDCVMDIFDFNMLPRVVQDLQRLAKLGHLEKVVAMLENDRRLGTVLNEESCKAWLMLLHKALENKAFINNDYHRTTLGNYFVTFFDLTATNEQGETLLIKFVRRPTYNFLLEELCKAGIDPNKPGMFSKTPLMHAVESCNLRGFQILCQYGADLNRKDMIGEGVAHKLSNKLYTNALVRYYASFVDAILDTCVEKNVNLNAMDNFYSTPLRIAVRNCANGLIIKLLDKGCFMEPTVFNYDTGMTLLHAYISHSNNPEWDPLVFQRLLLCNLDKVDVCTGKYQQGHSTPLVYAIQKSNIQAMQLLLMVNCDVNAPRDGEINETVMFTVLKASFNRGLIVTLLAAGYSLGSMYQLSRGLEEVEAWYVEKTRRHEHVIQELGTLPFSLVPYEHIYVTKSGAEIQEFHSLARNPLSLLLLARIRIRQSLGRGLLQPSIDSLPLPSSLKNFLYRVDMSASPHSIY